MSRSIIDLMPVIARDEVSLGTLESEYLRRGWQFYGEAAQMRPLQNISDSVYIRWMFLTEDVRDDPSFEAAPK
jgi:hypothetical protein